MSHHESQTIAKRGTETDGRQPPKDPFLAILVKAVNEAPSWEFGVTLHVNGLIISGLLCSMTSFFEEQAELIRQLGSAETAEARRGFAEIFDWLAEQSQSQPDIERADDDEAE